VFIGFALAEKVAVYAAILALSIFSVKVGYTKGACGKLLV
jgi:hypothetical protein